MNGTDVSSGSDANETRNGMGLGVAVGIGGGAALGVAMNDLATWMAVVGVALGVAWSQTGD